MLVIAYIFPPLGGSGVYRTAKFVKYLPQFGWQPVVVCGSDPEPFSTGLDKTLLSEIPPDVVVERVAYVSARGPRRLVKRWLGHAGSPTVSVAEENVPRAPMLQRDSPGVKGRVVQAVNALLSPVEFPPIDDAFYWALAIIPRCLGLIRQHRIKAIFTTSFPYSDHLTGLVLHRLTGLPWVADFRDPWSQNAAVRMTGWRRWCDVTAERRVLQSADRVIGVTPTYTAGLRALVSRRLPEHFVTIENGYDEGDFVEDRPADPTSARDSATLAHVGHVYPGTAIPFLDFIRANASSFPGLRLHFVGRLPEPDAGWLANHPLSGSVKLRDRCPHPEAIAEMRAAVALLLLLAESPGWYGNYPGKMFEYMRAGRPIVLIGPEGDAARLLTDSGTGCRVSLERPAEAVAMFRLLVNDPVGFQAHYFHPDPQVIARYERRTLTGKLAAVFEELDTQEHRP